MKKWFKNKIAAITFAFSNVEKNILNQDGKTGDNGTNQERRHLQGTLADSLVHGELTQEVKNLRWRNYKVLKASKGTELEVDYIDENGNVYYKRKNINYKLALSKIKLDEYDDYELDMVFNNNEITLSIQDAISKYIKEYDEPIHSVDENKQYVISHGEITSKEYFATNKTEKPLNVVREFLPKFFIENYTEKINIRNISDNKKLLEFYVNKYPNLYNKNQNLFIKEIKKVIDFGKKNINFLDINEINFITNNTLGSDDFLFYAYNNLEFDKIIEFNGYYVIKFKSDVLVNGEDILLDYVEAELEKKYENKELKK